MELQHNTPFFDYMKELMSLRRLRRHILEQGELGSTPVVKTTILHVQICPIVTAEHNVKGFLYSK